MPRILVVDDDPMVGATIEVSSNVRASMSRMADGGETGLARSKARLST